MSVLSSLGGRLRGSSNVALTGLALLALGSTAESASRDPSGVWLTEEGKARIRVEKCGGGRICGYVVWLRNPLNEQGKPRVDFRNPDPRKNTRPSLGHQMIMGLRLNGEGKYEGKIYNAESGKFYDVTLSSEDPGELNVRGCVLSVLCGSQSWTLKSDVASGQLTGPTNGPNGPRADPEFGGSKTAPVAGAQPAGKPAPQRANAPKASPQEAEAAE